MVISRSAIGISGDLLIKSERIISISHYSRFRHESMSFRDLFSHRHGLRTESFGSSAGAFKDLEEFTLYVLYTFLCRKS